MSDVPSGGPPAGSRYADVRPYAIADTLGELHGPTSGVVVLDRWLDWSGSARYDLAKPGRLERMHETVLREASTTATCPAGWRGAHWSGCGVIWFCRRRSGAGGRPGSPS
ncbi:hypothetical protein FF36_05309 [Frankia torreyi]|uniref:Uncharacterized protein n=1 Tax=Frankia torreyi TaxID=1856 RepID=A0A0D8B8I4_9ACTN|nr:MULTISPECIES: hypothetical protein [Frankia]KJE20410.1 hypothetical protein FF36_05309 [Frankia torreyi]KQM02816.1 hypothetical protein FF86_105524 [Frankia sp. CpI1-P]